MRWPRRDEWLLLAIFLLAAGVRLMASLDDLWMDEIWSIGLVDHEVRRPSDVLFRLRHDNSHPLNSWWIYLLGPEASPLAYRMAPILLGAATVIIARQAMARIGQAAMNFITLLMLPGFFLVQYSSEARGYAYAVCFGLLAYRSLERLVRCDWPSAERWFPRGRRSVADNAIFGLSAIAATLGHATFVLAFAALTLWAMAVVFTSGRSRWLSIVWLGRVMAIPSLGIAGIWSVNYGGMQIGGGPDSNPWQSLANSLSLLVGGPFTGEAAIIVAVFVAGLLIGQAMIHRRAGDLRWMLWGIVPMVLVLPIVLTNSQMVYPRYCLCVLSLLYFPLAEYLESLWESGRWGRALAGALISLSVAANGYQVSRLITDGRGHAGAMTRYVYEQSPAGRGPIVVGASAPAFRHGLLIYYYARRYQFRDRAVEVLSDQGWNARSPQWVVVQVDGPHVRIEEAIQDAVGRSYRLQATFPAYGLSGWTSAVYAAERPSATSEDPPSNSKVPPPR